MAESSTQQMPVDIFVRFAGATENDQFGKPNPDEKREIESRFNALPVYLATHQPLQAICYFGGHNDKDPARQLKK